LKSSDYRARLNFVVSSYVKSGISDSLIRNSHMNHYDEETIDSNVVKQHLLAIVDDFCESYQGSDKIIDVLNGLTKVTKKHQLDYDVYRQTTIDAYLVDFLNYLAMNSGVDLALYVGDLY